MLEAQIIRSLASPALCRAATYAVQQRNCVCTVPGPGIVPIIPLQFVLRWGHTSSDQRRSNTHLPSRAWLHASRRCGISSVLTDRQVAGKCAAFRGNGAKRRSEVRLIAQSRRQLSKRRFVVILKLGSVPGSAFSLAQPLRTHFPIDQHVMSGLEAVEIVASISQLVQYSTKLIETLQDFCQISTHSAKRYRHHELQVRHIIQIAELIGKTKDLQSYLVDSHLISLAETTKSIEEEIERTISITRPISECQKCSRVLDHSKVDSAIFRGFENLERDKSCLISCLFESLLSLIQRIRSDIQQILRIWSDIQQIPQLQGQLGESLKSLEDYTKIADEIKKIQEVAVVSSENRLCSSCGNEKKYRHESVSQDLVEIGASALQPDALLTHKIRNLEVSEEGSCTSEPTLAGEDDTMEKMNSCSGGHNYDENPAEPSWNEGSCTYSGITARDQASQINGSFSRGPSEGPRQFSSWIGVHASDKANQWNGNIEDASVLTGFFSSRCS